MNTSLRLFTGLPTSALITAILFLILAALIRQQQDVQLTEDRSVSINVTRQLEDRSLQRDSDFQRPVLDQPPPPPPVVHDPSFRPTVTGQLGDLPDFSKTEIDIGTGFNPDRDAQPLVRIPPQYPDQCQRSAKSSETVTVEFNVTPEGTVVNPQVLDSTNTCFNRAALRAVERWRYQPRIVDNQAKPRFGVRTSLVFNLAD